MSSGEYKRQRRALRLAVIGDIPRELDCDGVVEGTVISARGRVRVDAQLVHAPKDHHLWAESYESDMSDMLLLERQIAEAIARQVHGIAVAGDGSAKPSARRVDPMVYALYVRGRDVLASRNPAGLRLALALFGQTIARDSQFALGYTGMADTYRMLVGLGYAPVGLYKDSARVMATRALELDSSLSEAHASLAGILTGQGKWTEAEGEFRKAIALEPGNALAHHWYAMLLVTLDRRDEAVREIRRAKELDPLSQPLQGMKTVIETYAGVRGNAGRPGERKMLSDPTHPGTIASRALGLAQARRCPEA